MGKRAGRVPPPLSPRALITNRRRMSPTAFQAVLEAEASNTNAIALYESLGFFRDKRLEKYYLNGGDAYRLKKWFPDLDYTALYNL